MPVCIVFLDAPLPCSLPSDRRACHPGRGLRFFLSSRRHVNNHSLSFVFSFFIDSEITRPTTDKSTANPIFFNYLLSKETIRPASASTITRLDGCHCQLLPLPVVSPTHQNQHRSTKVNTTSFAA